MAKLVDALDLGSSALRHGGSSPFIRTQNQTLNFSINIPKLGVFSYYTTPKNTKRFGHYNQQKGFRQCFN